MPQIFENFIKYQLSYRNCSKFCSYAAQLLSCLGEKNVLKCVFFGINSNTEILKSHGFGELNCKNVNVLEKYCSRSFCKITFYLFFIFFLVGWGWSSETSAESLRMCVCGGKKQVSWILGTLHQTSCLHFIWYIYKRSCSFFDIIFRTIF